MTRERLPIETSRLQQQLLNPTRKTVICAWSRFETESVRDLVNLRRPFTLKLRDALREMALRDGLTGLYNRRYLEDAMTRELNRAERNRTAVSVIMIDIDHFKRFTDKFGHAAGDFVLNAVARTIASSTRASDIACRYGGEAPAVMLADADLQSARERAEQMRQAIRGIDLNRLGQTLPPPDRIFGPAVYPQHGTTAGDLLKGADRALYRVKQEGRDRVCVGGGD